MTIHSPAHFHLGQVFDGAVTGLVDKGPAAAKSLVLEVADDGHRGVLLLLPFGGRFEANRSFMRGWKPSQDRGAWYLEKYAPNSTEAAWHAQLPDIACIRAVILDERKHGNTQTIRVIAPSTASREDVAALEELGVVRN